MNRRDFLRGAVVAPLAGAGAVAALKEAKATPSLSFTGYNFTPAPPSLSTDPQPGKVLTVDMTGKRLTYKWADPPPQA